MEAPPRSNINSRQFTLLVNPRNSGRALDQDRLSWPSFLLSETRRLPRETFPDF
jgi:hypothetical protein